MNQTVCNPVPLTNLWDGDGIGDPYLMRWNGTYYLYCSGCHEGVGFRVWTSEDMVNFTYQGAACDDERIYGAYAPEVLFFGGKFYMVTSPKGSGHYVLVSDSPLGPFKTISDNYGCGIDGSMFVDQDGKVYFSRAAHDGIRVHDMSIDGKIDVHSVPMKASFLGHWTEGPMIIRRDGRYFMTETGNHLLSRGYRIDYCVSHEGPNSGYRTLNDTTLLLETRDEFHGLGHSSNCVGPDMDTEYIIYHKYILNKRDVPHRRSCNMDRLHFNGDRMYAETTWWPAAAPTQPVCKTRNGEGMVEHPLGCALPEKTGDVYTAEVCFTMNADKATVFFADDAKITIGRCRRWKVELPEGEITGRLPEVVATDALLTVRISMKRGSLLISVNGIELFVGETALRGGAIGLDAESKPGFVGFSDVAQDSADHLAQKIVPGTFDAIRCRESGETVEGEKGCFAAVVKSGEKYTFPVNVVRDGKYHLLMTMKATAAPLTVTVNGETFTAEGCGTADKDGMEKRWLGRVALNGGVGEMTIEFGSDAAIDRISLLESDDYAPMQVVARGEDASEGKLQILGHKNVHSMIHKFSGFTCAENYGEGYVGAYSRDMAVRAVINMTPCSPTAGCAVFLRSRLESWFPHQVATGRIAYAVNVTPGAVKLTRQSYNNCEELASVTLSDEWPGQMTLVCRAEGNRITVQRETAVGTVTLIDVVDPMGLPCGRVGIDASGDGVGFESVEII